MTKVTELLNAVKALRGIESDYTLAKILGIPNQRICDYYKGRRSPDEYACLRIAKEIGKSYEEITALVRIEAEKDEKRREVWREHLKRLGGYAAAIMLWFLAGMAYVTLEVTLPQKVYAASTTYSSHLIRNTNYALKKFAKEVAGFVRIVLEILVPRACFSG